MTETEETRRPRSLPPVAEREWRHALWDVSTSGVLSIVLNRPERLNALNFRLLREVHQLIQHARSTPEIRVVATPLAASTIARAPWSPSRSRYWAEPARILR